MSFNGNLQKYGAIAIILGSVLAIVTFSVLLNVTQDNPPEPPPPVGGVGSKIAERMEAMEENISYIWCYNNTFTNINISNHFQMYIDGVRIGLVDNNPMIALIHEPEAEINPIDQQDLNSVMADFRDSIAVHNDTSTTIDNLIEIWPPTFMIDIAYEDSTSISVIYSQEYNLLSVVNGTWTLSAYTHHGINTVETSYAYDSAVFFELEDPALVQTALQSFANLIYDAFP